MATLVANVVIDDEWYGPDYGNVDKVPADVARKISNPDAWEGGEAPADAEVDTDPKSATRRRSATGTH
jgi:hypothetical protein